MVKNPPAMQERQVQSLGQKDPWRRKWQSIFAQESPRECRTWWATVHAVIKSQTQLSRKQELCGKGKAITKMRMYRREKFCLQRLKINHLNKLVQILKDTNYKNENNKQLTHKMEAAKYNSKTQNKGERNKDCRYFRMLLNVNEYQLKTCSYSY